MRFKKYPIFRNADFVHNVEKDEYWLQANFNNVQREYFKETMMLSRNTGIVSKPTYTYILIYKKYTALYIREYENVIYESF